MRFALPSARRSRRADAGRGGPVTTAPAGIRRPGAAAGRRRLLIALALGAVAVPSARAGHEFPFYPSYYPQEITLQVESPAAASAQLAAGTLHAYVGGDPFGAAPAPPAIARAESLGALVLVRVNPAAPYFADPQQRCRAARAAADLLETPDRFRRFRYPVTPYHPDYLQHADLARAAEDAPAPGWPGPLRLRAGDAGAEPLVAPARRAGTGAWDASVETLDVAALWTPLALGPNGGVGPPDLKTGWWQAYQALRGALADPAARDRADALYRALTDGTPRTAPERLTLERRLVATLTGGCERIVAGFTLRAEPLNVDYSAGVENVAHDAQSGLGSAIFPRTVKLKDFPWNGWLTVGVPSGPAAAWNPVAGFSDPAGRLLWLALGDPALFPSPHGTGWVPNRVVVSAVDLGTPTVAVPEDAIAPAPGTGAWAKVGPGRRAGARVLYRVLGSRFHDGTTLDPADLLYALGFAWRAREPAVRRATAGLRDHLVALRVLRVETDVLAFGEDKLTYQVPIVEVFVDRPGGDPDRAAGAAPPWTTVPWHLLALMEEAAARDLAAFSRDAATARGIPWLDLARDARVGAQLSSLLDELEREARVPPSLAGRVTPAEARARWAALRAFHGAAGHFLVTNGPYRLAEWSPAKTVLRVFRDLSYPRGVGVFNAHAAPLRAWATEAILRDGALVLRGDVERVERFGREQRVVREPFVKREVEQDRRALPVARYVVVAPDGSVVAAGAVPATDPGEFRIALDGLTGPGRYEILAALTVDDVRTNLPVRIVTWTR